MYAVDALSLNSQGNAKSSLQALLRTREQNPASTSQNSLGQSQNLSNLLSSNTNYLSQVLLSPALENSETDSQKVSSSSQVCNTPSEILDNRKDFHYSQKLFHIADGNLYSIFSPIQGRSYGMKPSFLRKQKYTVQECRSRGRKNLRKGLKFHNFLPSESVTSEKDNGYLRNWKVHSECRLREEHGTKQITISNWSQSIQNLSNEQSNINSKSTVVKDESYLADCLPAPKRININDTQSSVLSTKCIKTSPGSENNTPNSSDIFNDAEKHAFGLTVPKCSSHFCDNMFTRSAQDTPTVTKTASECSVSRKDVLDNVLSTLIDSSIEPKIISCDMTDNYSKNEFHNQKHRRKPVQTRRIVPYTKYLSLIEETESIPLDLSSKCVNENCPSPVHSFESKNGSILEKLTTLHNSKSEDYDKLFQSNKAAIYSKNSNQFKLSSSISSNSFNVVNETSTSSLHDNLSPPLTLLCPLPFNQNISNFHGSWASFDSNKLNMQHDSNSLIPIGNNSSMITRTQPDDVHYTLQKPFGKDVRPKTRRRSQRSVIKQKLEDTFRQNGFLVKTKQVSDGEATFCKFRQLRKYTRYYLKSWQQHLPDEVHKMWKGFLPPKTVIPSVPNLSESTKEAP